VVVTAAKAALKNRLNQIRWFSRPLWKAYYHLFPRERIGFRAEISDDIAGVFTEIFRRNEWFSTESRSGFGSELAATETVRRDLPLFAR